MRKRRSVRAVVGAGLSVLSILGTPLLLGYSYVGGDFVRTDMGYICELQRQWATGNLWVAPHIGNGGPLFADPVFQMLYPPRWVSMLFAADLGASIAAVLQLAFAAAGAAWLLRSYGLRPLAAGALGAAFALSGTVLNLTWHASYMSGAAMLPWAWAAGRRALQRNPGVAPFAIYAAALALLLLGAEPLAFGCAVGVVALEGVVRLRSSPQARVVGVRLCVLTAAAIAIGLVQWLPASAELTLTPRSAALSPSEVLRWSFVAPQWLAALAPGVLSERVAPGTSLWLAWFGPTALASWNPTPYLGPLLLAAAVAGVKERRARAAALFGAAALLVSLGKGLPGLETLLGWVPQLAMFRYPSKLLLPATLAAIVLGGVALQGLARRGQQGRRRFLIAGSALAAGLLGFVAWVALGSEGIDAWAARVPPTEQTGAALPSLSAVLLQGGVQGLAPLLAGLAVVWQRPALVPALPFLVAVDLLLAAPGAVGLGPRLDAVSANAVEEGAVLCHSSEVLGVTARLNEQSGVWSEALTMRGLAVPNVNACDGIRSGIAYSVVQTRVNVALERDINLRRAAAARAAGCTHLLAMGSPSDEPADRLPFAFGGGRITLSRLHSPLAGAFAVVAPRMAEDETAVMTAVRAAHTAEDVAAIIDDPLGRTPGPLPAGGSVVVGAVSWPEPSTAEVTLLGTGGAVVAIKTSFQAGWRATQAGISLPVVRSAGSHVAAVVADAARGPVTFDYVLPRRAPAAAAGILGLVVAAMAAWVPLRRRKQP